MDLGIKILYMMSFGNSVPIHNMYHELTKVSPVFYYFERNGLTSEKLELIFKHEHNKEII